MQAAVADALGAVVRRPGGAVRISRRCGPRRHGGPRALSPAARAGASCGADARATRAFASAASGQSLASDAGGAAASGGTRRGAGPHGLATSAAPAAAPAPRPQRPQRAAADVPPWETIRSLWRHGRAHARGRLLNAPAGPARPRNRIRWGSPVRRAPAGGTGDSGAPGASSGRHAAASGLHRPRGLRAACCRLSGPAGSCAAPSGVRGSSWRLPARVLRKPRRAGQKAGGFGGGVTFEEVKGIAHIRPAPGTMQWF